MHNLLKGIWEVSGSGIGLISRSVFGFCPVRKQACDIPIGVKKALFVVLTGLTTITIFSVVLWAQEGDLVWNRTYGIPFSNDIANCVIQTGDGGYLAVGFQEGSTLAWVVKTDSEGNPEWDRTYGFQYSESVVETTDGGFALAGRLSKWPELDRSDAVLVKTNSMGDVEWSQTYDGHDPWWDGAYCIIPTDDGGFALAGEKGISGWLIKTDSSGTQEWEQTYKGPSYSKASSVVQTEDGGYALATWSSIWKTDPGGVVEWSHDFQAEIYDIMQTDDGGYALAGTTPGADPNAWLCRMNSMGETEWIKTYDTDPDYPGVEIFHSFVQTWDGGYLLSGQATPKGPWSLDSYVYLVRTDSLGNPIWDSLYHHPPFHWASANSIAVTDDGGYIVAGLADIYGRWSEFWLLKLAPESPTMAIESLMGEVEAIDLEHGMENSLDEKLTNARDALNALNSGSRQDAINKMEAFINAVNAQRGKKLTDQQAYLLIERAQAIIAII